MVDAVSLLVVDALEVAKEIFLRDGLGVVSIDVSEPLSVGVVSQVKIWSLSSKSGIEWSDVVDVEGAALIFIELNEKLCNKCC